MVYLAVEHISFGVLLLCVILGLVVCGCLCVWLVGVVSLILCAFSCVSVNSICWLDLLSDWVRLAEHVFYMFLLKV